MLLGEAVYSLKNQDQSEVLPSFGKTQVFLVLVGAKIGNTYLSDSHYSLDYIPLKSRATKPQVFPQKS